MSKRVEARVWWAIGLWLAASLSVGLILAHGVTEWMMVVTLAGGGWMARAYVGREIEAELKYAEEAGTSVQNLGTTEQEPANL